MSITSKQEQLKVQLANLKNISLDALSSDEIVFPEWEGLSFPEFVLAFSRLKLVLTSALEKEVFRRMPFAHLNGIQSTLQGMIPVVQQFITAKDFGSFQNAANQVDSLHHLLHAYGVIAQIEGLADASKSREVFEAELTRLSAANTEADKLSKNVRALIEPAVSGSLSTAFSERVRNLFWTRCFWGVAAVALGGWGLVEATLLVSELKGIVTQPTSSFWSSLATRSIVLVPIYVGFGFVLSQYKKERDFEEEYAHKASIATSLPNYRDLAKEDSVKDQIASRAAEVIFSPPTNGSKGELKTLPLLASVKGLVDSLGKAAKRE
ncbi:MAG: hypothetical protein LW830_05945 [Phenylobacterium sp.]|jgi:hypothetical protein|nr:hypothetical protein [Phenylobacterium sp.]